MLLMWHCNYETSSPVAFARAAEIGPKSHPTGERFIFQGCIRQLNALYDGQMLIAEKSLRAARAPFCFERRADG
jgi:hypothetical protein